MTQITIEEQISNPSIEERECFDCSQAIQYHDHLEIVAKRLKRRGSFNLHELKQFWNDFKDPNIDVYCGKCSLNHRFDYCKGDCDSDNIRYVKKIITLNRITKIPNTFTLCRDCCETKLGIDYDNYNEYWYRKAKERAKINKKNRLRGQK